MTSHMYHQKDIKSGTSGYGLFVVPHFQPAMSIDHLHVYIKTGYNMHQQSRPLTSGLSCISTAALSPILGLAVVTH